MCDKESHDIGLEQRILTQLNTSPLLPSGLLRALYVLMYILTLQDSKQQSVVAQTYMAMEFFTMGHLKVLMFQG